MNRTHATRAAVLFCVLVPCAFGLNPSLDISQYGHTAWTIRDGFIKGRIYSITQTSDGYLMLGTEFGLVRFDGIRAVEWVPPQGQHLPSNNIRTLLNARDGTLWIGTLEGLASWKDGTLTEHPELAGQHVYTLIEDREGTVWAGTFALPTARLCQFRGGNTKCFGEDGSLGHWVESVYEDHAGNVWAGAETGLWRWKPGSPQRYVVPHPVDTDQGIVDDEDRAGLIFIGDRLWRMQDGKTSEYQFPGVRWLFNPLCMLRDRDGALWMGTLDHGLMHLYRGRTDLFSPRDGLSGDHVRCLFQDREGNIWVGTADGLDRFRAVAASSVSVKQGLSAPSAMSVLVDHNGVVWSGTTEGVNRWKDGQMAVYRAPGTRQRLPLLNEESVQGRVHQIDDPGLADNAIGSLIEDDRGRLWVSTFGGIARFENGRFNRIRSAPDGWVNGFAGEKGGMWIAYQDRGLYHLGPQDQVVDHFPWEKLGPGVASSMTVDPARQGLWLGFFKGGVVYFDGSQVRAAYGTKEGLGAGRVMGLRVDESGVVWAGTEGGLSRIKDGGIMTLSRANGLGCDAVHWTVEDHAHFFWLYTPCGMMRVPRAELDAWAEHANRTVKPTVLDASDGIRLVALLTGYTPRVSQGADGRFWFAHLDSISQIDPDGLEMNRQAPPVEIEQITADHKVYWQNSPGQPSKEPRLKPLPPLSRDVVIDYSALSLVAPEKMRFRYKLEGYDSDWQEAGNRRQAFYNELAPRSYTFRVIACNNSGVWNEAGAMLEFSIAPAYYQTMWFRTAGILAIFLALWGLYRLRLYQMGRELHAQLEGRVDERLRVARELHDTLLQSVQAVMLHIQTARNLVAKGRPEGLDMLDGALRLGGEAIAEGREAIQNMRSSTELTNDLAQAMRGLGEEMASEGSAKFRVVVEGSPRDLHPILRDEVYGIAREAVRNALRHSEAKAIEMELDYRDSFRVRIRDDGKGMDPAIVNEGRPGHYGIRGMRERAARIGGKLSLWSAPGAGTEIDLSIPAWKAYAGTGRGTLMDLLRRRKSKSMKSGKAG